MNLNYSLVSIACFIIITKIIINALHMRVKIPYWKYFVTAMLFIDFGCIIDAYFGLVRPTGLHGFVACYLSNFSRVFAAYYWLIYSEHCQHMRYIRYSIIKYIMLVPFVLISVFAYKFNVIDYYNGAYFYTKWYLVEICIIYGILLCSCLKALYKSFQRKNYQYRKEYRNLGSFFLYPALFILIQIPNTEIGVCPIISLSVVICCVTVFLSYQSNMISRDFFTGLANKSYMLKIISGKIHYHNDDLYLIMIDGLGFKKINDRYGHNEGDKAILQIAEVLKIAVPRNYAIARFGGDEFLALGEAKNEEFVKKIVEEIALQCRKFNLTNNKEWNVELSVGYAKYDKEKMDSILDFIDAADKSMYANKRKFYEALERKIA